MSSPLWQKIVQIAFLHPDSGNPKIRFQVSNPSFIRKDMMNFNESEQWNISEKVPNLVCAGATDEDLEWFGNFSYWIEGVFQLGLGKSSF